MITAPARRDSTNLQQFKSPCSTVAYGIGYCLEVVSVPVAHDTLLKTVRKWAGTGRGTWISRVFKTAGEASDVTVILLLNNV